MDVVIGGSGESIFGSYKPGKRDASVLFLPPHPRFGGGMDCAIVYKLCRLFEERGFHTLRFSFAACARKSSDGWSQQHTEDLADVAVVVDWLQQNSRARDTWLVGISFGAWVGMQVIMRRVEIENFVFVGLPVNLFDFGFLQPAKVRGLVVQGDRDTVVPEEIVANFVPKLKKYGFTVNYDVVKGADHNFAGMMDELVTHVGDYLKNLEGYS